MTPDEARQWLQIRDMLVELPGSSDVYHEVYRIAVEGNFGDMYPWERMEKLASQSDRGGVE